MGTLFGGAEGRLVAAENSQSGSCQCGSVRYAVNAPLPAAYACHCSECKKQSASAFSMSMPVEWARLSVVGEVVTHETVAFSGIRKLACFCPHCGTRMWHRSERDSDWITLKVGTLECAQSIEPRGHLWVSKKQPWIVLDPAVPAFDTQPEDVHAWRASLA
jgi:hypothetical protein